MKKLMTMLAAVGMAFGLFADEVPSPIVDTVDFSDSGYTFATDAKWTYNGVAITEAPADKVWVANNLLNLATGSDKVQRTFVPGSAAQVVSNIYLDANINFEDPFDEAPVLSDSDNAKIAAFVLDNSGIIEEQGADADLISTNLYVIAGYNNGGTWEKRAFMLVSKDGDDFAGKTAKRLTIKAYGDVMAGDATRMGFRFFLNGDTAIKDALLVYAVFKINDDDGSINFKDDVIYAVDDKTPYLGTDDQGTEVKDLLEPAVRARGASGDRTLVLGLNTYANALSGFDLAGKGELAKFTLTTASPAFIDGDSSTVTLDLVDTVVTVTGAGVIDYDQNSITFAGDDNITVTATYTNGVDIVKWKLNTGDEFKPAGDTYSWKPNNNDVLAISAKAAAAFVEVGGVVTPYETFDAALTAVCETGGTLKLAQNYAVDPSQGTTINITGADVVLDLAGKTIKSSDDYTASITVAEGAKLTITNSTDDIGHVAVPYYDEGTTPSTGDTSIINKGALVIAGGIMDGKVVIAEGATAASITGGTFMDAITDKNEESVLLTTGGNFVKGEVFGTDGAKIPGLPESGYDVVTIAEGYWTVVPVTGYIATFMNGTEVWDTQTDVTEATAPAKGNPTKADNNFKGWAVEGTSDIVEFPYAISADTTFDAIFEEKVYVAQINDDPTKKYETLAEAVGALEGGETINLLTNYQLPAAGVTFDKACTFDLGGYTLTVSNDVCSAESFKIDGVEVTIQNGTIYQNAWNYETGKTSGRALHVMNGATLNVKCSIIQTSASAPALDVYAGTVKVYEGAVVSSPADTFRCKEEDLTSTFYIYGGVITNGNASGLFYNYKTNHTANVYITGGELVAKSGKIFWNNNNTEVINNCTLDADCKAKFSAIGGLDDHIAEGYKAKLNGEWYEIVAIQYATLTVDADAGVKSYVLSNATEEITLPYKADKDLAEVITAYVTEFNDGKVLDDEKSTLSVTLDANAEIKIVTKSAAPVIPPVAPGGAPVVVNVEDADKVVITATAPAESGITDVQYTAYFKKSIVEIGEGKVSVSAVLDEEAIEFAESVEDLGEEVSKIAAGAESATIAAKPGLYYYVEEASDVTEIAEPERDRVMATGATVTVPTTKFEGSGFYRLKCSTTQRGIVTGQ